VPAGGVDASDYRQVRRMARQFSRDLDKELKKALREAGNIGVRAVRQKVDTVPAGRTANRARARGSLRATVKRNTRVQVRSKDVRVIQGARGIPGANARGLPRRLNQIAPFTHPVFGREPKVSQRTWRHFDGPIRSTQGEMARLAEEGLRRAVEALGD
jgi:hypothetical protein